MLPSDHRTLWKNAMDRAGALSNRGERDQSWAHLERAHILSQPYAWPHVVTHLAMLRVALLSRDGKEVFGQIARTLVAAPGSLLKKYPEGNTGRSNVSMFQPMALPPDLLEDESNDREKRRG